MTIVHYLSLFCPQWRSPFPQFSYLTCLNDSAMWKKHPKALPFLFFSEMWERFGYYLMIGIFTLYLKDSVDGVDMDEKESASHYGNFRRWF
jgi:dipeptide/tripeptide permease